MRILALAAAFFSAVCLASAPVLAEDDLPTFEIRIKDHKFDPAELTVPAGREIRLVVKNLDPTPEEFESYDFNREKIIAGKGQGIFYLDPLEPGVHAFFGEFNQDTAQGRLIAK